MLQATLDEATQRRLRRMKERKRAKLETVLRIQSEAKRAPVEADSAPAWPHAWLNPNYEFPLASKRDWEELKRKV